MRLAAVLLILAVACGTSRDGAEQKARAARAMAESAEREARALEARIAAEAKVESARAHAEHVARRAQAAIGNPDAVTLARAAKAELDKVYKTQSSYDLDVTTPAATASHAAKLAAMPHVTVGGLTVGYEEVSALSITGTSSSRHFRATWRRGDRDVIVGYQTQGAFDLAAFAALLQKLVPVVEKVL